MADAFTVWAVPRLRTESKGHSVLESVTFVAKRDGAQSRSVIPTISKVTKAIEHLETGHSNEILRELCRGKTVRFSEKFFRNDLYSLGFFTLS
jgi:hypothetical protein